MVGCYRMKRTTAGEVGGSKPQFLSRNAPVAQITGKSSGVEEHRVHVRGAVCFPGRDIAIEGVSARKHLAEVCSLAHIPSIEVLVER